MDEEQQGGVAARVWRVIKKVLLWALSALFAIIAFGCLISGGVAAGLIAIVAVVLLVPIDAWQNLLGRLINVKAKVIIVIALVVLCVVIFPTASNDDAEPDETSAVLSEDETKKETTIKVTPKPTATPTAEATATPTATPAVTPTAAPTATDAPSQTAQPTPEPTAAPTTGTTADTPTGNGGGSVTEPTQGEVESYVVNKDSKKFHRPSCSSAGNIKEENRWDYSGTRDELVDMGYSPCKRCKP